LQIVDRLEASNTNLHTLGVFQDFHHSWYQAGLEEAVVERFKQFEDLLKGQQLELGYPTL